MSFLEWLKALQAARSATKETKEEEEDENLERETSLYELTEKRTKAPSNGETKEAGWRPSYAAPWPDLLDLGPRTVHPFASCADCGTGTWVQYGPRPLCLACAQSRAGR